MTRVIDLAGTVRTIDDVTVFSDHADARRYHVLPVRPRLVTDDHGVPDVRLLKYHLDPAAQGSTGAGLFSLTVDLAVADDVLTEVRNTVAAAVGHSDLTLTPVWPDSGTCQLILLDNSAGADQPMVRVIGGAAPALAANATTMFVCALDPAGVAIVEQALQHGGLPFGIVYNLQVAALRPALRATITADYGYAYHYYENRLHGGQLLLATDIGATIQDLTQQQAIEVAVDDLVPDADKDGVYKQALDTVQQYILQTLFTPTLSQSPPAPPSAASMLTAVVNMFTVTYSLNAVDTNELKKLTYNLAVAEAEEITLAPQGDLNALLPTAAVAATLITNVDPAPPDQLDVDVATLVDLGTEAIDHVDVTVTYAGKDTALTLDETTPRVRTPVWYDGAAGLEVGYRYELQLAADGPKGISGRLAAPTATSVHDLIRIDPRALYRRVDLRTVVQGVPFDRFPRVIVDVVAHEALDGWTASDTISLDMTSAEQVLSYRGRADGLITLRARVRYVRADGQELTVDWADVDAGTLVLGDPEPDIVDLQVLASARFGTAVARLVVELRPDASPTQVSTLTFDAATTAATWSYEPSVAARGYSYRVSVQTSDGAVHPGQWLPGPASSPVLVVGEGYAQLRRVKVVFVGTTLAAAGLLALRLRLNYSDPVTSLSADDEFLVQDPVTPLDWSYPVADPAREDYTFTLTRIATDGTSHDDTPSVGSELIRVVPITAAP